ncbi:MAG: 30S ribosomal protein S4 [Candidatus Aenigmatarchaeota archaeon]|nr:MAG: 30S ribosomal protein S4 [Candidatus Aenigmarchaeota archaeon]
MARYTGSRCKLCRREGTKLFLKGEKCTSEKCPFSKRPYPPGMKGRLSSSKPSYYALQLREKQKVKRIYGVLERQFRRYYQLASKSKGVTGKLLLQFLERRLDNVVFRLLFALSRSQARQIVRHGFVFVNGRRVDIPSFLVRVNDKIEIRGNSKIIGIIKKNIETASKERSVVSWLFLDKENLKAEVLRLPEKEDITVPISEQLIVELYSK